MWIWVKAVNYLVTVGALKLKIMTYATSFLRKGLEKYLNNVFIEMEEKDVLETLSLSEMLALAYDID